MIYFVPVYLNKNPYFNNYFIYIMIFIVLILTALILTLFFNLSLLIPLFRRLSFVAKFKKYIKVFSNYKPLELLNILLLSIIRYIVFSLQYYIIIYMFGVKIPITEGLIMISLIFLIMSVIPTIALIEIGIRGSVALYFISFIVPKPISVGDEIGILTSSFAIWIINLVVPAIIGAFFIPNLKFFRK